MLRYMQWDPNGGERFRITEKWYRRVSGIFIVYDVLDKVGVCNHSCIAI